MRVVVQRVKGASVEAGARVVAAIGQGLLVLVGFARTDDEGVAAWMARKVPSLRVFEDEQGKMNLSLEEIGGELLVVSQFTLYGDCHKGKRPSFDGSASPREAEELYAKFLQQLEKNLSIPVKSGIFREHMHVKLINDGPVTLIIEKD